jgi:hypothetical protein
MNPCPNRHATAAERQSWAYSPLQDWCASDHLLARRGYASEPATEAILFTSTCPGPSSWTHYRLSELVAEAITLGDDAQPP